MDDSMIFLFVAILIIGVALFALVTLTKRGGQLDVEKYRVRWMTIEQSLKADNEASRHLAIMNADKLLDLALKESGVRGQTMGDRLKFAKEKMSNRNAVWQAHKLRNQIAHEPDVQVTHDQARRALAGFKQALKDLGAI